ncbi:uncharacterized protein [Argopecten irradians]|uniref:uncharacterized protein n=1 Tax=Argopecten irradians TaxID=31199 RepID=UPI00371FBD59
MTEERPSGNESVMWLGNVGEPYKKWDNGLYIQGNLCGIPVNFLIDTGSTATLIPTSVFHSLSSDYHLTSNSRRLLDVNGNEVKVQGRTELGILIGDTIYHTPVTVCDINGDAILGQDFLLKHITRIDYRKLALCTNTGDIPCWLGGETQMVCKVSATETTVVPPFSRVGVRIYISGSTHLADAGLIEMTTDTFADQDVLLLPGIVNTRMEEKSVTIVNFGSVPVTLYPNMRLGTCESYYEEAAPDIVQAVTSAEYNDNHSNNQEVPPHLTDLLERSSVHISADERRQLALLLTKYENVFSQSSSDLGRTDRVQHRINTGTAHPIRQPTRRLPFGKRDIEKAELEKMIERGVVETIK